MKAASICGTAIILSPLLLLVIAAGAFAADLKLAGRITYVGTDNNIYYCDGGCAKSVCLSCPVPSVHVRSDAIKPVVLTEGEAPHAEYNWPTYSPDGQKLAYISTAESENGPEFGIYVYDIAKRDAVKLFQSNRERPIYIFWLPDNQSLSFLISEPRGLRLMLAKVRELAPARIVMTGMPMFFDWNLPRHELVVHTSGAGPVEGEQVSLVSLTDTDQQVKKVLSLGHTPFQAPAWSPDRSHLAYVSAVKQNSGLFVSDPEGKDPRSLVELPDGQVSFVWAPDSHHIAYSTAPMPGAMIFDGINLLDTTTAKAKKLVREPVAAFYFSPDSKYLAYVVVPEGKAYYQWKLANLSTGKNLSMFNFITTRDESLSYRFFDQLALSHAIWSPDSKALVFAGVPVTGEAPRASVGPSPPPYVFIVPIDHPHPLPVAEGTLAFWSPSPAK